MIGTIIKLILATFIVAEAVAFCIFEIIKIYWILKGEKEE